MQSRLKEVNEMRETEALSAWSDGETLLGALERYTDARVFAEYKEMYCKLFPPIPPIDLRQQRRDGDVRPPAPLPYDPARDVPRFLELQIHLRSEVLGLLRTGKISAVGYSLPRGQDQEPEWVPAERWASGVASWDDSELWAVGYAPLVDIRVVRPSSTFAEIIVEIPSPESLRKPGRPSSPRHLIIEAYEAFKAAGRIDFSALSRNFGIIKEAVLRLDKDAKGLGDRTIRSTLSDRFSRGQEEHGFVKKGCKKSSKNRNIFHNL
jgi:hypothetical protein